MLSGAAHLGRRTMKLIERQSAHTQIVTPPQTRTQGKFHTCGAQLNFL